MRLKKLKSGHKLRQKIQMLLMRLGNYTPFDVNRALMYRPEFFGEAMGKLQTDLNRSESDWTLAERELFCAFVSKMNGCPF